MCWSNIRVVQGTDLVAAIAFFWGEVIYHALPLDSIQ